MTTYKAAKDVQKGDQLVLDTGEAVKVRKVSKGVTVGGICFEHRAGYSEVHRDVRLEVKP